MESLVRAELSLLYVLTSRATAIHRQGYKAQAIARQLGIGRSTVFNY